MVVDAADSNQLKVYNGSSWVSATPTEGRANHEVPFTGQTAIRGEHDA
jgi:hypothetical protein